MILGGNDPVLSFNKALGLVRPDIPNQMMIFTLFYRAICLITRDKEMDKAIDDLKTCIEHINDVISRDLSLVRVHLLECLVSAGKWTEATKIAEIMGEEFKDDHQKSNCLKYLISDIHTTEDIFVTYWRQRLAISRQNNDNKGVEMALNFIVSSSKIPSSEKEMINNELGSMNGRNQPKQTTAEQSSKRTSTPNLVRYHKQLSNISSKSAISTSNLTTENINEKQKLSEPINSEISSGKSVRRSSKASSNKTKTPTSNFIKFVPSSVNPNKRKEPQTQIKYQNGGHTPSTPQKSVVSKISLESPKPNGILKTPSHKKSPSLQSPILEHNRKSVQSIYQDESNKVRIERVQSVQNMMEVNHPRQMKYHELSPVLVESNFNKRTVPNIISSPSPHSKLRSSKQSFDLQIKSSAKKSIPVEHSREVRTEEVNNISVIESPISQRFAESIAENHEAESDELIASIDLFLLKIKSLLDQEKQEEAESFLEKFQAIIFESELTENQIPRQVMFKKFLESILKAKKGKYVSSQKLDESIIHTFNSERIEHPNLQIYQVYNHLGSRYRERGLFKEGIELCTDYLTRWHMLNGTGTQLILKLFFKIADSKNMADTKQVSSENLKLTTETQLSLLDKLSLISKVNYTNVKIPPDLFSDKRLEILTLVTLSYLLRDMPTYAKECLNEFSQGLTSISGDRLFLLKEMTETLIASCQADLLIYFISVIDGKQQDWPHEDKHLYFASSLLRLADNRIKEERYEEALPSIEIAHRYFNKVQASDFSVGDRTKLQETRISITIKLALCKLETISLPLPDKLLKQVIFYLHRLSTSAIR